MKEDFNKFINNYEKNKNLIKDNSFKTIEKFMSLFKNPLLSKLKSDIDLDFIIDDKIKYKFNEENNIIKNIEKEYLIKIYISQKENLSELFFEKLLNALIDIFDPIKIFLNIKFFKKSLKFILRNIKNKNILEIINKSININKEIDYQNKKNIILFLYYYYIYNKFNNDDEILNSNNINFEYIKVIFDLRKILNLYLAKESDYISCQNYFNYIFNKHFFTIKDLSKKNNILFPKLLNTFLNYI